MGVKDSKAKEYLSDNRRFSEICNYMLFGGAKIIKPQDLKECDSTEVLSIFGIDRNRLSGRNGETCLRVFQSNIQETCILY